MNGYERFAHWRVRLAYEWRVVIFEATFHPALAWLASLTCGALSFVTGSWGLWSKSHDFLGRVDGRGPLFRRWRRSQERRLRTLCEAGVAEAAANRLPFVAILFGKVPGLVLKPSNRGEKGILLLKNTERMDAFRRSVDMPRLLAEYFLVLEPSWSGYADPRILAFTAYRDHPILLMSSCEDDTELLRALNSNLIPLALSASDWVHPAVFRPLSGSSKRFDAVLNARWTIVKRHHILFRALREMRDQTFRVAILARNVVGDKDRESLLRVIKSFGLGPQIEVFEDLPPAQVNEVLNESKVNLLLSRKEGSNRSLFEGFFADVPGVAFANHIGIPKQHFTLETGRLIAAAGLPETLRYFRTHWECFHPRTWAVNHISPERSTEALNRVLQRIADERGELWTSGAVAKCNLPGIEYYPGPEVGHGFPTSKDLLRQFANTSDGEKADW